MDPKIVDRILYIVSLGLYAIVKWAFRRRGNKPVNIDLDGDGDDDITINADLD